MDVVEDGVGTFVSDTVFVFSVIKLEGAGELNVVDAELGVVAGELDVVAGELDVVAGKPDVVAEPAREGDVVEEDGVGMFVFRTVLDFFVREIEGDGELYLVAELAGFSPLAAMAEVMLKLSFRITSRYA